jgi:catechol 2,3-dioxygenase-like lactoylglutathione lyase family enzyme
VLPAPSFHHLHLNSVDPDAAIAFYAARFPTSTRTRWGGLPGLALGVADLDAWVAKLRDEGVTFLEEGYRLGDTRAVMIEGPSREALELVEVR